MNQKQEITKVALESIGLIADEQRIKKTIPLWWQNARNKNVGGLGLTLQGFTCLKQAGIKNYEIKFDEPVTFNNGLIVWMDQNLDCPFYVTHKRIWVFAEKAAVQLVLFAGNLQKFKRAKERSAESN